MHSCDKTYLINLPERTDRLRFAKKQFAKAGIEMPMIYPAVDAKKLKLTGTELFNQGLIGCFMSHYIILQHALLNGYKRIAIFEDDVVLVPDFKEKFDQAIEQVPAKWQLLYLGYYERYNKAKLQVSENITIPKNSWGTHAYMVQNEGIQMMFDNLQTIHAHLDVQIDERIVPKMYTYCVFPAICNQSGMKSDIS